MRVYEVYRRSPYGENDESLGIYKSKENARQLAKFLNELQVGLGFCDPILLPAGEEFSILRKKGIKPWALSGPDDKRFIFQVVTINVV